jgi:hypothetical protein
MRAASAVASGSPLCDPSTAELAAPAIAIELHTTNLLGASGTPLLLPVKVHLETQFLGGDCYIGLNAHLIVLNSRWVRRARHRRTNPITGNPGELALNAEETVLSINHNVLVNNSFAAPG